MEKEKGRFSSFFGKGTRVVLHSHSDGKDSIILRPHHSVKGGIYFVRAKTKDGWCEAKRIVLYKVKNISFPDFIVDIFSNRLIFRWLSF